VKAGAQAPVAAVLIDGKIENLTRDLETLKAYLRHLTNKWIEAGSGRNQKEFAALAKISASHLSNVYNGDNFSDDTLLKWLAFLDLGWVQAFDRSVAWDQAKRPGPNPVAKSTRRRR
jgi:transcriptional regulator with XRE-family HTH domain